MGGVRNARMIKAQVCCIMGCKWCMAYAYILVCYVIPRASPSELHKHPRMYTYAIHHYNPCYNIYMYVEMRLAFLQVILVGWWVAMKSIVCEHSMSVTETSHYSLDQYKLIYSKYNVTCMCIKRCHL